MSIQRLCFFFFFWGGGGGSITEALPGVGGTGGKEHSSQDNRRTKGPINFEEKLGEHWGTGKIWGTREQVPSSLPGRALSVVCNVLISA